MSKVDSIISKGMGAAKSVKAAVTGLHGVFATLTKQHGEVAALLERAKSSDAHFGELWPKIRTELVSHERGEVREVYPALRGHAELRALCDHHDAEASELEQRIARIDELPVASAERRDAFAALVDTVLHHAKEEEQDIFPKAQDAIGKDKAERLDAMFLTAKRQVAEAV